MTTRTRRKWKPDSRGYYTRQIGWVVSKSGKNQQQKFLLGKDLNAAETRERKLRELWDRHASKQQQRRPLWPDDLLEIGKLIARGVEEIAVPQKEAESQIGYAGRIRTLQASYPVVLFLPANRYSYDVGCAALHQLDQVPGELPSMATEQTGQQPLPRQLPKPALGNFAPATPAQVSIPINSQVVLSSPKYGRIDQPETMVNQTRTMGEAVRNSLVCVSTLRWFIIWLTVLVQKQPRIGGKVWQILSLLNCPLNAFNSHREKNVLAIDTTFSTDAFDERIFGC